MTQNITKCPEMLKLGFHKTKIIHKGSKIGDWNILIWHIESFPVCYIIDLEVGRLAIFNFGFIGKYFTGESILTQKI